MLQWFDGSWEHRAYWGANFIGWRNQDGQQIFDGRVRLFELEARHSGLSISLSWVQDAAALPRREA